MFLPLPPRSKRTRKVLATAEVDLAPATQGRANPGPAAAAAEAQVSEGGTDELSLTLSEGAAAGPCHVKVSARPPGP